MVVKFVKSVLAGQFYKVTHKDLPNLVPEEVKGDEEYAVMIISNNSLNSSATYAIAALATTTDRVEYNVFEDCILTISELLLTPDRYLGTDITKKYEEIAERFKNKLC